MRNALLAVILVAASATASAEEPLQEAIRAFLAGDAATAGRLRASPAKFREALRAHNPFGPMEAGDVEVPMGRLYVPEGYTPEKAWPLVIALHGTGCPCEMPYRAWRPLAEKENFLLLCPRFPHPGTWRFLDEERRTPLEALAWARARYRIDPARVLLTGMSKGGHAAWDVGLRWPHLFAGIVPEASCAYDHHDFLLQPTWEFLVNALDLPVRHIQGEDDQPELVRWVKQACARLKADGRDVAYDGLPGRGHEPAPDRYPAAWAWMQEHPRPALPKRCVARCFRPEHGRRAWARLDAAAPTCLDPRKRLDIPGAGRMTEAERTAAFGRILAEGAAFYDVEAMDGNRIRILSRHVKRLTLFLDERLVDLARPVEVEANGKKVVFAKLPVRLDWMLEDFRESGDPDRCFPARIGINP